MSDGTTVTRKVPVEMKGLAGVSTFAIGAVHGLGLEPNGSVVAWGHNRSGQLGNGSVSDSSLPVSVAGLGSVKALAAGDAFSIAVQTDGSVLSWGKNHSGELGDGTAPTNHATPVHVSGLGPGSGVIAVSGGESHALALKADGEVLAWGNNASGQVGDGTAPNDRVKPVAVSGLGAGSGVVQVAAGGAFSLALKGDGSVLAWGNNASGQLGDGTAPTDHHTPVLVSGLGPGSGVVQVAAGATFALALKSDGTILAWGNNARGELGDGAAPADRHTPVPVTGATGIVAIAAGWEHALALKSDGSVLSWGDNALGQLGDNATSQRSTPGPVAGFGPGSNVMAVYAGGTHSHAVVGLPRTTTSGAPGSSTPGPTTTGPAGVPGAPGAGTPGTVSGRGRLPRTRTATPMPGNPATVG